MIKIKDVRELRSLVSVKGVVCGIAFEQGKVLFQIQDICRSNEEGGETIIVIPVSRTASIFRRIKIGDRVDCIHFRVGSPYSDNPRLRNISELLFSLYFEDNVSFFRACVGPSGDEILKVGVEITTQEFVGDVRRSNVGTSRSPPIINQQVQNSSTPLNQRVSPPPPPSRASQPHLGRRIQDVVTPNQPLRIRNEVQDHPSIDYNNVNFTRLRDLQENQSYKVCTIIKEYWYSKKIQGMCFFRAHVFDNTSENPNMVNIRLYCQYRDFDRLPKVRNVGQVIIIQQAHVNRFKGVLNLKFDTREVVVLPSPPAEYLRDLPGRTKSHNPIPQWKITSDGQNRSEGGRPMGDGIVDLTPDEQVYVHQLQQKSLEYFSHPRSVFDDSQRDMIARCPKYLKSFSNIREHVALRCDLDVPMMDRMRHSNNEPRTMFKGSSERFGPATNQRPFPPKRQLPRQPEQQQQQSSSNAYAKAVYWDHVGKVIEKDWYERPNRNIYNLVLWDGTVPPNKPIEHRRKEDHDLPIRYPLLRQSSRSPNRRHLDYFSEPIEYEYTNQKNPPDNEKGDPRAVMEVKVVNNQGLLHQIESYVDIGQWVMIRNVFNDWADSRLGLHNSPILGLADWDYRVVRMKRRLGTGVGYLYIRSDCTVPREEAEEMNNRMTSIPDLRKKVRDKLEQDENDNFRFLALTKGKITVFSKDVVTDFCRILCNTCNFFFEAQDEARFRMGGNLNRYQVMKCRRCSSLNCVWTYDVQFQIVDTSLPRGGDNDVEVIVGGAEGEKFFGRPASDLFTGPNCGGVVESMKMKVRMLMMSGQRYKMKLLVAKNRGRVDYYLRDTRLTCETYESTL